MPALKKPTIGDRVTSLESRVSVIEATLNGRLQRLEDAQKRTEEKVDNISGSIRDSIEQNNRIVKGIGDIRDFLGIDGRGKRDTE